ncbi:hypothetical protein RZS08_20745, partial [Arthrospira platensis SPKY1]|nr:hypothetical protein [Arthrospira platensis SPKY1]
AERHIAALELDAIDTHWRRGRSGCLCGGGGALGGRGGSPCACGVRAALDAGGPRRRGGCRRGFRPRAANLTQVQPPLLIENQPGVEIVDRNALHGERERLETSVNAGNAQGPPAHEVGGIEAIDRGKVGHAE